MRSRFLERHINPHLDHFRGYIGEEVIVGLKGKDQYGNEIIGYITGIVGFENDERSRVALHEIVDTETGRGKSKIIPLNFNTPIAEAFFPARLTGCETYGNHEEETRLVYRFRAEPFNPHSTRENTNMFVSNPHNP